jgi:hypothetical protein
MQLTGKLMRQPHLQGVKPRNVPLFRGLRLPKNKTPPEHPAGFKDHFAGKA